MKKAAIVGMIWSLVVFVACTKVQESQEYKELEAERDSLYLSIKERDEEVEEITSTINEIETNISAIEVDKDQLMKLGKLDQLKQKDKINMLVSNIYVTIERNHQAMKKLEGKLASTNLNNKSLENLVVTLKQSIANKELEIDKLRQNITVLEGKIDTLQAVVNAKERVIAEQKRRIEAETNELYFAYFIQGNHQELIDAKIIKKEGGFLGLGSVKMLKDKLPRNKFKTIDTRIVQEIELGVTKKKILISTHPKDSYFFLSKDGRIYLKISFPEKFWSISKYLVVETD